MKRGVTVLTTHPINSHTCKGVPRHTEAWCPGSSLVFSWKKVGGLITIVKCKTKLEELASSQKLQVTKNEGKLRYILGSFTSFLVCNLSLSFEGSPFLREGGGCFFETKLTEKTWIKLSWIQNSQVWSFTLCGTNLQLGKRGIHLLAKYHQTFNIFWR